MYESFTHQFYLCIMIYGTLLAIDDNASLLTALRYTLEGTFERVITITSPDDALRVIAQEQPDIVLLDMNFTLGVNTGQDGLFWLRAIRNAHPELPVVLMTAYADINIAVKGLKSGAADFITKPWDNEELLHKLKDVLEAENEVATLDSVEAEHIRRAIDKCHGNMKLAAEMLGITRQTLYNRVKRL